MRILEGVALYAQRNRSRRVLRPSYLIFGTRLRLVSAPQLSRLRRLQLSMLSFREWTHLPSNLRLLRISRHFVSILQKVFFVVVEKSTQKEKKKYKQKKRKRKRKKKRTTTTTRWFHWSPARWFCSNRRKRKSWNIFFFFFFSFSRNKLFFLVADVNVRLVDRSINPIIN